MTLGKQRGAIVLTLQKELKKELQEQKPMKGGEPIIHCDRTCPLRLQLNPNREQRSVDKKVQIHLPNNGLPRKWSGKKRPKKNQTRLIPCYSEHFLQQKCVFFHLFFVIRFSSTETCTKKVQHEAKKGVSQPQARREGKRKKILRTASERKKSLRT